MSFLHLACREVARRSLGVAGVLAVLAASSAPAQSVDANLRGYVRGANAASVENAQIATRSLATSQTRGTTTSVSGYYFIGGLRPGSYEVTIRRIGFVAQTDTIRLLIGQTRDLNFNVAE